MKGTIKFFLLLILSCALCSVRIKIPYDQDIIDSKQNSSIYSVNLQPIPEEQFLQIKVVSKEPSNPTRLYVSFTGDSSSNEKADYKNIRTDENLIYIPTKDLTQKESIFLKVECQENCSFHLLVKYSTNITLLNGVPYSFTSPKDTSSDNQKIYEFEYKSEQNSEDTIFYAVAGITYDFTFEVSYNLGEQEVLVTPLNLFYNGRVAYLDKSSIPIGTTVQLKIIALTPNDYITVGVRNINQVTKLNLYKNQEIYGYINITTEIKEECFEVENIKSLSEDDYVLMDISSLTQNAKVYIKDKENKDLLSYIINTPSYIKFDKNDLFKTQICITQSEESEILISFAFQIFNIKNMIFSQPNRMPIVNGLQKKAYLPPGLVTYHKRSRYNQDAKYVKMSLIALSGNPILYSYTCQNYPYCYINEENLKSMIENNETALNRSNEVNNISILSAHRGRCGDISMLDSSNYLSLVYCKGNIPCEYIISIIDEEDEIFLRPNTRYSDYIPLKKEDEFQFTLINKSIEEVEISLYVYTGDAVLEVDVIEEDIEPTIIKRGSKTTYNYKRKGTIINEVLQTYYVTVRSITNCIYSLIYSPLIKETENEREIPSGVESLEFISKKEQTKTFLFQNRKKDDKEPYYTTFNSFNCKIEIEYNGEKQELENNNNTYFHIIKNDDPSYNDDYYKYKINVLSIETSVDEGATDLCMVSMSGIESNYKKDLIITEGSPHTVTLDPNVLQEYSYKYPYPNNRTDRKEIIINFNMINEGGIKVQVTTETGEQIYEFYFSTSRQIVIEQEDLKQFCLSNTICGISIKVELIDKEPSGDIVTYNLIVRTKDYIPVYLKKNYLRNDIMGHNQIQYYYTDIGQNEYGEVLINFNKGSGKIFARLVKEDIIEEDADYNERIKLPNENSPDLLNYDDYTNKISFTEKQSNKCIKGCLLIIGVQNGDKFIEETDILYLIDYSIFIRTRNRKPSSQSIVILSADQYVIGSLTDTITNSYYDYYSFQIPFEAEKVLIEFVSDIVTLYLNIGIEEDKPTSSSNQKTYKPTREKIISFTESDLIKKGNIITLGLGTTSFDDIFSASYSIKITVIEKEYPTIIKIGSQKDTLCEIENEEKLCYFILPIHNYDKATEVNFYATNNNNGFFNSYVLYYNVVLNKDFVKWKKDDLINNLPTTTNFNYSSKDNFETEFSTFKNSDYDNQNYFIILGVTSNRKGVVYMLSTFRTYVNYLTINPGSLHLLTFDDNRKQISIELSGKQNYLIKINKVIGEGTIQMKKKEDTTTETQNLLKINSEFENIGISVSNTENTIVKINSINGLKCYVNYNIRSDENFDEVDFGRTNAIAYKNTSFPLIYFSFIPKSEDIDVTFRFYDLETNQQDSSFFPELTVTGVILNEDFINSKEKDKDLEIPTEGKINGIFIASKNIGKITFPKTMYEFSEDKDQFLCIIINMTSNDVKINKAYTEISPFPISEGEMILPSNKFFYGNLANINYALYKIRKTKENDKYLRLDFSSADKNLLLYIMNSSINDPNDFENFTTTTEVSGLPYSSSIINLNQLKEIFVGIKKNISSRNSDNDSSFVLKYQTGNDIKDVENKYIIGDESEDSSKLEVKDTKDQKEKKRTVEIVFKQISYKSDHSIHPSTVYSIYVFDNKTISSLEMLNSFNFDYEKINYTVKKSLDMPNEQTTHPLNYTFLDLNIYKGYYIAVVGLIKEDKLISDETKIYKATAIYGIDEPKSKSMKWYIWLIIALAIVILFGILILVWVKMKNKREKDSILIETNIKEKNLTSFD